MERLYGEKSYRPSPFEIDFWGTKGGEDREYREFQARKIKGNILLAAYYTPVTIQEISIELGVALPYLEDEIKPLVARGYLVCKSGKYLTNIPIFTLDCTKIIDEKLKTLTEDTAKKLIAIADDFLARFGDRFANENLARWQKILLCLHYSLLDTDNDLAKNYGELPSDGPYSLVNGGGGRGIIWGRSAESMIDDALWNRIEGIYNGTEEGVIAMNFPQSLNAQRFCGDMADAVTRTALGGFDELSDEWRTRMETRGYAVEGKANFAVWSSEEYRELRSILADGIEIVSELNRKTAKIAADVTADLAPAHIRATAEYVGAFVYRFQSIEKLVNTLFDMGWLKAVQDTDKPAICVRKH